MKQHTITTLPPSPEVERKRRMLKYTIAMSIRVLCIFLMLFAQGWWLVVCAAGAIFLPYIAVVLANVGGGEQGVVERPGGLVPVAQPRQMGAAAQPGAPSEPDASSRADGPAEPDASSRADGPSSADGAADAPESPRAQPTTPPEPEGER